VEVAAGIEGELNRPRAYIGGVLLAASLIALALAQPPGDRFDYPTTSIKLTYTRMKPRQGGQRVHVTIPSSPGVNQYGDRLSYRWDTRVSGGERCQPGALPDLSTVSAGTVIDAPLSRPAKGWCRGSYGVTLVLDVTVNCDNDPPPYCQPHAQNPVASASFMVGKELKPICHRYGEAERCWYPGSYRQKGFWAVNATLDDLLGPDGATTDAWDYFDRAFAGHHPMDKHWEIDDNFFYGYPATRREAIRMAKIVDRVLRAGPYYHRKG
jgi:hypothetical protein